MRKAFLFVIAALVGLVAHGQIAKADIGSLQLCNINTYSTTAFTLDSNDWASQSFTPPVAFNLAAVKVNFFQYPGANATTLSLQIVGASSAASGPDISTLYGEGTFDTADLPSFDLVTAANNAFLCDSDQTTGQIVELDSPVTLHPGTYYTMVWTYDSGATPSQIILNQYTASNNGYPDGAAYKCIYPTSCSPGTPTTWDPISGALDLGFALYDNVPQSAVTITAEDWFDNWLQIIGATTIQTKTAIIALIALGIIASMYFFGGAGIIAAVVAFLFVSSMSYKNYVEPAAVATGLVIIVFAAMVGLILLRSKGGEN